MHLCIAFASTTNLFYLMLSMKSSRYGDALSLILKMFNKIIIKNTILIIQVNLLLQSLIFVYNSLLLLTTYRITKYCFSQYRNQLHYKYQKFISYYIFSSFQNLSYLTIVYLLCHIQNVNAKYIFHHKRNIVNLTYLSFVSVF